MRIIVVCLILGILAACEPSFGQTPENDSHIKWVESSLKEMETIKAGMTRADLLKVFRSEGGLSTRQQRTYVYRQCPYFKVLVEFSPAGNSRSFSESSKDKIVKISQPFLQWIVVD